MGDSSHLVNKFVVADVGALRLDDKYFSYFINKVKMCLTLGGRVSTQVHVMQQHQLCSYLILCFQHHRIKFPLLFLGVLWPVTAMVWRVQLEKLGSIIRTCVIYVCVHIQEFLIARCFESYNLLLGDAKIEYHSLMVMTHAEFSPWLSGQLSLQVFMFLSVSSFKLCDSTCFQICNACNWIKLIVTS